MRVRNGEQRGVGVFGVGDGGGGGQVVRGGWGCVQLQKMRKAFQDYAKMLSWSCFLGLSPPAPAMAQTPSS